MDGLTEKVLGAAFAVSNGLGAGFSEAVYERALMVEMGALGIRAQAQVRFSVFHRGQRVGDYLADMVVEGLVVVELKCVELLVGEHAKQCLNYLRASGLGVCLLINFGQSRVDYKRLVLRGESGRRDLDGGSVGGGEFEAGEGFGEGVG